MKVNIALVGGQAAPVFHVIDHYRPDKVVFIASSQSKESIERIQTECEAIGINDFRTEILHPTDPAICANKASELCNEFKDDEVVVNISSGTKAWSHIFGYLFQGLKNSKVVYIDQNNKVYDFHDFSTEEYKDFDWERNFRLNNSKMKSTSISEYDSNDFENAKKLYDLWRKRPDIMTELAVLMGPDKNTAKKKDGRINFKKSKVEWYTYPEGVCTLKITWNSHGEEKVFEISSQHARDLAFNSGWSEVYVAKLMLDWRRKHGKTDDGVKVNCVFPSQQNKSKNEVDVLVNAGQKALFVECKTKISKINDIDKFHSVTKNYGGLASKGIFISFSEEESEKIEKLEDNHLLFYSLKDKNGVSGLYQLIDNALKDLNER